MRKLKFFACITAISMIVCCFGILNCSAAVVTDGERFYEFADVNGDDEVDIRDLVRLKKHFVPSDTVTAIVNSAADIDSNSSVDSDDLVGLRRLLLGHEITSDDLNWTTAIR